jgi:hypothetical protein
MIQTNKRPKTWLGRLSGNLLLRVSPLTFLQALYSEHQAQPVKTTPAINTWTDVLLKLLLRQHNCYIIIDALDECIEV